MRVSEGGRSLSVALFGKAFEDLDAEFFCGRAFNLPELVPEPDHFALFLDGHESPPPPINRTKWEQKSSAIFKGPSAREDRSGHFPHRTA
jgi:hypothetical protein